MGQKRSNQIIRKFILVYFLLMAFLVIMNNITGCRTNNNSHSSKTAKQTSSAKREVNAGNVKEYFGYGDETVVIDCSDSKTASETGARVKAALRQCPKRVLLWDQTFMNRPQDHPYMYGCFWVENAGYGNSSVNGIEVGVMQPVYTVTDPNEIDRMQREIDKAAQEILAKCPERSDYFGSCIVIHDELIKRVTYDHSLKQPHIYDIYGALVNGKAVCQGYAYAFSYLTDLLGYDSVVVVSNDHAWNMMNSPIDCNDRFVDVTWDDLDDQDSRGNDYIIYDYFGLTKEEVEAVDSHVIVGVNGTQQATIEDHQPFNYHEMYGYVISSYSYKEVVRVLKMQKLSSGRTVSIKFLNDEAWNDAKAQLLSERGLIWDAIEEAYGNSAQTVYWYRDAVRVLDIGLQ